MFFFSFINVGMYLLSSMKRISAPIKAKFFRKLNLIKNLIKGPYNFSAKNILHNIFFLWLKNFRL